MNHNQNSSLLCGVLVNTKLCGKQGDAKSMSYTRLPGNKIIVTCKACTGKLDEGAKVSGSTCCHAPVAAVRALSKFRIKLIPELKMVEGHCSFSACSRKLSNKDDSALRKGAEHRRICNECGTALDIIATRAKDELAAHEAKTQTLSDDDLAAVREEAKLMPEKLEDALKEVQRLREGRLTSLKSLFLAQLETAKPERKPEKQESEPKAKAKGKRLPKGFGSRCRVLVSGELGLGIVAFMKACHRAHESNTVLPEEIAKTPRGCLALAESDEGMAVLVRLGKRQAPAEAASAPAPASEAPVPVAPSAPAASAEAQAS